jgi:hypothetical protein
MLKPALAGSRDARRLRSCVLPAAASLDALTAALQCPRGQLRWQRDTHRIPDR